MNPRNENFDCEITLLQYVTDILDFGPSLRPIES